MAKAKKSGGGNSRQWTEEIRTAITKKINDALKEGKRPWVRPWRSDPNCGLPRNIVSKKKYRGINPLLLELASEFYGFRSQWWATYRQWEALDGQVKKRPADVSSGQWGTHIVYWKFLEVVDKDAKTKDGKPKVKKIPLMRTYTVFNLDQVEGENLDKFRPGPMADTKIKVSPDFSVAQKVVEATGAKIVFGGDRACYKLPTGGKWPKHKGGDYIQMPPKGNFADEGEFYDTEFHELAHWSEVRISIDRETLGYAMCELVAEITACYMAAELHLPQSENLDNHTRYLAEWLSKMSNDNAFIFKASTLASTATDFLLNFSGRGDKVTPAKVGEEGEEEGDGKEVERMIA